MSEHGAPSGVGAGEARRHGVAGPGRGGRSEHGAPSGAGAGEARRRRRWWTVRVRLTALYGALFLVSGAVLLAVTYGLLDRATSTETVAVVLPGGGSIAASVDIEGGAGPSGEVRISDSGAAGEPEPPAPAQIRAIAARQHAERMDALLAQSGIALGVMAIVSVALGWFAAGRALRPLRTITATTMRITERDLGERLQLAGADDEITELGDTIDGLLARLERSFRAQRQFIANASHELRTPLARQRAIAQVALDDPEATADSLRLAHERVLAAGARQEQLVGALLTLASGQAGSAQRARVDPARTASTAVATHRAECESRGITVTADVAPAPILADPRLLERLVENLLDNAIRYNRPGGSVHVSAGAGIGEAVITVANTGPEIPPEVAVELVEPFRRLEPDRTGSEGHGLGLSIVAAIAEAHGGSLEIRSQSGGGLRITASFPADTTESAPAASLPRQFSLGSAGNTP